MEILMNNLLVAFSKSPNPAMEDKFNTLPQPLQEGIKKYHKFAGRDAFEEFMTQVMVHYAFSDRNFTAGFMGQLGLPQEGWTFEAEASKSENRSEFDILATNATHNSILIIECKIGAEISFRKQLSKYCQWLNEHHPDKNRYLCVLSLFSGLITIWDGKEPIKEVIKKKLQEQCGIGIISNYIYWYEVYSMLEKIPDCRQRAQLKALFEDQNSRSFCLCDPFYAEFGSGHWRRELAIAFNKIADQINLPHLSVPANTTWIDKNGDEKPIVGMLPRNGKGRVKFDGARIRGARTIISAHDDRRILNCTIDGKVYDLSNCVDLSSEDCIKALLYKISRDTKCPQGHTIL